YGSGQPAARRARRHIRSPSFSRPRWARIVSVGLSKSTRPMLTLTRWPRLGMADIGGLTLPRLLATSSVPGSSRATAISAFPRRPAQGAGLRSARSGTGPPDLPHRHGHLPQHTHVLHL